MPFLPTSDQSTQSTSDPADVAPAPGATYVAEAATAEAALIDVQAQLGADAQVIDARRVLRGGIGGFFAKELVQIHAAPRPSEEAGGPPRVVPTAAAVDHDASALPSSGTASPVDRLLADVSDVAEVPTTVDFGTYLRRQLGGSVASDAVSSAARSAAARAAADVTEARVATERVGGETPSVVRWPAVTPPAATTPSPAVATTPIAEGSAVTEAPEADRAPERARTAGHVGVASGTAVDGSPWSAQALLRLGLPPQLIESLDVDGHADDAAWTFALAAAIRPLCRPMPAGLSVLVGPRAKAHARKRQLPLVDVGSPIHAGGDVAAVVGRGAAGRAWLAEVSVGRWQHVLVGGSGWRRLLGDDVLAVSWASVDDLPDAVRCAVELGLVLGNGPLARRLRRARPLDVALELRALLEDVR